MSHLHFWMLCEDSNDLFIELGAGDYVLWLTTHIKIDEKGMVGTLATRPGSDVCVCLCVL